MVRKWLPVLVAGVLGLCLWSASATPAHAQNFDANRYIHYPYYYFPHNYWPSMGPTWPEPIGAPYRPAPAYMAYPPFREPNWRYEWWQPQSYYRGFHFWLDVF
jgi:hypothetical protein